MSDPTTLPEQCQSKVQHDASPSAFCADTNARYAELRGMKIGPGFTKKVKSLLGGTRGCTHLTELLGPLATTAIQTFYANMQEKTSIRASHSGSGPIARPMVVDTCQACRRDAQAMQLIWPLHRRVDREHAA